MINRGLPKKTQYVFNAKTGKLEKKNRDTIKSFSSILKQQTKDLEDIGKESNKEQKSINQITVITATDNLIHNYFYDFEHIWDASNCVSIAVIKMPKMNTENINYWATYQGTVTVYGGYNFSSNVNTNSNDTEQATANKLVELNSNADIKPFFRGVVSKIKEYSTYIDVYVDGIGIRFKQKIPDEFRQSYINNQNVRDAFQAICEFIGIDYICPPQIEDQTADTTGMVSTNGTENDVSTQEENLNKIAQTAKDKLSKITQSSKNTDNNKTNQQNVLFNSQPNQNTSSNPNSTTNENINNTNENATDTNTVNDTNSSLTNNKEIDVQLKGFADINFDANGAITHGSSAIETSPDMAETLVEMEENPLERYVEDESGVVEKVQKFLDGEIFEELHNNVMDYGAITIQPKSTTTSEISSSGTSNTNASDLSDSNNTSNPSNSNNTSNSSNNSSSKGSGASGIKGVWGKTAGGSFYLTQDAINKMSMAEAKRRYEDGQKRNIYTRATMEKLWYRMMFGTKFF